ncbi:NAD-dependent epimerase/dehydratase family protein [Mesorhizobium muleiense]|uniref:NAD-dependent epimerase/dehydratase family protein n=1 Tax=Mesorhizobium muleiense TaxID=1004279 RepID=UPI003AFA97F3
MRILAARGNSVRATVRNRDDPRTAGPIEALDNVAVESLDVCDAQRFESISKGVDTLFHLAATYKFHTSASSDDEQMVRDSVEGARAAILAAAKNGIR